MSNADILWDLPLQASNYDDSGSCAGGICRPAQAVNDGAGFDYDDLTFWQTPQDPYCQDQWLFMDWSSRGTYALQNFTILYGPTGDQIRLPINVQVSTVGNGWNPMDIVCTSQTVRDVNFNFRKDICAFQDLRKVQNSLGMNITWHLTLPLGMVGANATRSCSLTVAEIVMPAVLSYPSWNPFGSFENGTLSPAAIAAIILVPIVVIVPIVALFITRAKNLRKRAERAEMRASARASRASKTSMQQNPV
ncbi:hypothetical protein HDU76_013773 [Blyttiomyces sp. JEL0837]|nr:hypothetical protein HDU76_013773 [Blyttiomyces sp. JEL0837]